MDFLGFHLLHVCDVDRHVSVEHQFILTLPVRLTVTHRTPVWTSQPLVVIFTGRGAINTACEREDRGRVQFSRSKVICMIMVTPRY